MRELPHFTPYTVDEKQLFARYYHNIQHFLHDIIGGEVRTQADYIPGTDRIDFYTQRLLNEYDLDIDDYRDQPLQYGGLSYEEAIFNRFLLPRESNILVLIGGLGSGKTTAVEHITALFARERARLQVDFPCKCRPCHRAPLLVNCLDVDRNTPRTVAGQRILEKIRFKVYNALLVEWLLRNHLRGTEIEETNNTFKILRRLLITNDISTWADAAHPNKFPLELQLPKYHLDQPLLSMSVNSTKLNQLVRRYAAQIDSLAAPLRIVTEDREKGMNLTALVARFYLSTCSPTNPANLFIVDNLDQLFTGHIEYIMQELYTVAERADGIPMLVPLRPSSINPFGFVRRVQFMHHYGPHCPAMILHRLHKYVLAKSRSELAEESTRDRPAACFQKTPADDEIDALLLSCYLYAKVATAGLRQEVDVPGDSLTPLPRLHANHEWLERLEIADEALRQIAETLSALVGTYGRYAIEQLDRYFRTMYHNPGILANARRRQLHHTGKGSLSLSYGSLVTAVVSAAKGGRSKTRLANLFKPPFHGANPAWPTLAMLRTLHFLAQEESARVVDVLQELSRWGIPTEIGILNLNNLHDRDRLLIWFSTNSDLKPDSVDDYNQYVTISEHGLNYLQFVVGDFEYMWFCAQQLSASKEELDSTNFRVRLEEYVRLVKLVGLTEWKQLSFRRCLNSTLSHDDEVFERGELLTLRIVYSSLERAMTSSRVALSVQNKRSPDEYAHELRGLIGVLAELVLEEEQRYVIAFGDQRYLERYSSLIEACRAPLRHLVEAGTLGAEITATVIEMLESWTAPPSATSSTDDVDRSLPPKEDYVTLCSKYARGVIPAVADFVAQLDKVEAARIFLWQFLRGREKLTRLLERRLPTATQVERYLGYIIDDAQEVIACARDIAATGSVTLEWLVREESRLASERDVLTSNQLQGDGPWRKVEMDERKTQANRIMDCLSRLATSCGAGRVEHLKASWQ